MVAVLAQNGTVFYSNGTVFLPNGVGNCTFRLENLLIAPPRTAARHLQQLEQSVATGCKHSDSKSDRIVWTSTTIFRLEEGLSGSKGGRESAGGGSCDMRQETAAKQSRKR